MTTRTPTATTPAGSGKTNRTTIWLVLIGAVIVVGLGIAAAITTMGGSDSASGSGAFEATPSSASGTALVGYDEGVSPDPAIGQAFPELRGLDLDKQAMSITNAGRPKVVVFLAHWCPHCQREVPVIRDWLAANPQAAVDTLSVTTSIDPGQANYPPSSWLEGEKWTIPTLVDGDGSAAKASGLTSFPYFVVVGADGKVVKRGAGELSTEQLAALYTAATAA